MAARLEALQKQQQAILEEQKKKQAQKKITIYPKESFRAIRKRPE